MYDVTEKVLAKFDQNAASAFKTLLQSEYLPLLTAFGNDIKIVTDDTWAFKRTLILKNADNIPSDREGYLCAGLSVGFKEEKKGFVF